MSPSDTHPEMERFRIEGLRRMSKEERLQQVVSLNRMVEQMAIARIRRKYGEIPDRELKLRLASLHIDRETMIKAFGWDPNERGY